MHLGIRERTFWQVVGTCLLTISTHSTSLDAQTLFVNGGIGANVERGATSTVYAGPGLGGTTFAQALGAGIFVSQRVAVGFEGSFARPFTKTQRGRISGGSVIYERRHQDTLLSAILRLQMGRIAGVGGFTAARVKTDEIATRNLSLLNPPRTEGPFSREYDYWSKGAVLGVDYYVIQSDRFSIAPMARLYFLDQDRGDASTRLGLGAVVFRPMLTIEARF